MAAVSPLSSKKVLVIDDLAGMRNQLQQSLTHLGFDKLHVVSSIREAMTRIAVEKYDVILCDYFLGDSTNGQQFLEYLRTRDLIGRNVIFVIITAESSYERVVVASECAPDDYLLKPFTAEVLSTRLERLLERQDNFSRVHKAQDTRDWKRAIEECDRLLEPKDKHFVELCRIKGQALLQLGRHEEAATLYTEILALRPLPWATLGLAQAQAELGYADQAQDMLRKLLTEHPQFMAAYDYLGQLLTRSGDKGEALQVLKQARKVSPGTLSRTREIGALAVDTGDFALAEQVLDHALKQHKFSPVREAGDYAILSRALTEQGKADKALEVIKEAKGSFRQAADVALLAANECLAYRKAGNMTAADAVLEIALAQEASALPVSAVTAVADACFAAGREDQANDLLKQLLQNNPDDVAVQGRVREVFAAAGKDAAEAGAMIESSAREVIQINNEGVRKAEAGQLAEAIELLSRAADRLPNNLQIVGNAALAWALDLVRNGSTPEKMQVCLKYRQRVIDKDPMFPKLTQIDGLLKRAVQKA
jgi:tetratricopeptide (TPR) repeat protein